MSEWQQITLGDLQARVHRKVAVPPQGSRASVSGWQRTTLGEVMTQVSRAVKVEDLTEARYAGVRWYGGGVYDRETVPAEKIKGKTLYRIERDDIVYNRMWATKASFGVVKNDADGCFVTNDFPVFMVNPEAILPEYIEAIFHTASFRSEASGRAAGTTERRRLHVRDFVNIPVVLPPLPVQERIVEIIGAVDGLIIALEGEAEALDEVYRGVLLSLGARYGEVKISEVVSRAFAGGTPSRSNSQFYGGDIPWLKSGEVESDSIVTAAESITEAGLQGSSAKMVPPGATVVAMYGQGDTKGRAGFVDAPISTNQAVLALVPDESVVLPRFLLHAVRSKTDDLRHRAVGSSQPNLSKGLVVTQTIPMPDSLADQEQALAAIDSVRANQAATRAEADRLREARPTLLSSLLDRTIDIESTELEV